MTVFEGSGGTARSGDRQRRALFLGAFLGVAGFAFASMFISYFESFPSNFYFWFLVALIWCEPMSEKEIYAVHAVRPKQQIVGGQAQKMALGLGDDNRDGSWNGEEDKHAQVVSLSRCVLAV